MTDPKDEFRAHLETFGLRPPGIISDGVLHRCPTDCNPHGQDGAYVYHPDHPVSGWGMNWRTGESSNWTFVEERAPTRTERQAQKSRIEADRRQREEDEARRHADAEVQARRILEGAANCNGHPYLGRKGVNPCLGLKISDDGRLVVPVLGKDGNVTSLQFIDANGDKRFLPGGRIKGGYFSIESVAPLERILICEGLATGLSIHKATGQTVFCAFNCGNLEHVAANARELYPDVEIVICADDDHATDGNPGLSKAKAAALAVGASLAVPSFKEPTGRTDFNDLHQAEGIEVVRNQLAGAFMPTATKSTEDMVHGKGKGWELARTLFPRIPFPWDIFPDAIACSLKQLGRSCATSATSLAALAFCLIAAAVGRMVCVQVKGSWHESLIFWFGDIRESGAGKTSALFKLAKVLVARQAEEDERFKGEMKDWESQTPKERKGKRPPKKPRGYFTTNMTLEGIHADLDDHPTGGVAVLLNELSAFIGSQNQYKKNGTDRESWLALHDGKSVRISRAKGSVFIDDARVQVYGGIQPAIFRQVFGGGNGQYIEDGTVYRFLLSYEPSCHYELTAESWSEENEQAWNYTLATAFIWADTQEQNQQLKLTLEAQTRYFEWRNMLDANKQDLPPRFHNFMPKAYGYAVRLAGAIHMLECFARGGQPQEELSLADMERGIKAVNFYLGQAVDALKLLMVEGEAATPIEVSERSIQLAKVLKSLQGKVDNGRLAVGFVQDEYNMTSTPEEQMRTARAMGSLLRTCGLTVTSSKHDANGRRRVCCLTWDDKTESFIRDSLNACNESQQIGEPSLASVGHPIADNTKCSMETLETLAAPCLPQETVEAVRLGDIGDFGDNDTDEQQEIPDMVSI